MDCVATAISSFSRRLIDNAVALAIGMTFIFIGIEFAPWDAGILLIGLVVVFVRFTTGAIMGVTHEWFLMCLLLMCGYTVAGSQSGEPKSPATHFLKSLFPWGDTVTGSVGRRQEAKTQMEASPATSAEVPALCEWLGVLFAPEAQQPMGTTWQGSRRKGLEMSTSLSGLWISATSSHSESVTRVRSMS